MRESGLMGIVVGASRIAVGIAFAVLCTSVLIQVLGRSFAASPVWTEELTRFALLYLAAFGAGLSYRSGDLVNVDLVCEALPGRWPWVLRLVSAIATALLCLLLVPAAWRHCCTTCCAAHALYPKQRVVVCKTPIRRRRSTPD